MAGGPPLEIQLIELLPGLLIQKRPRDKGAGGEKRANPKKYQVFFMWLAFRRPRL
jgi:hypothetical protein